METPAEESRNIPRSVCCQCMKDKSLFVSLEAVFNVFIVSDNCRLKPAALSFTVRE